jgi:toxin YhaV
VLQRHGWRLAGHPLLLDQLDRLIAAAERARQSDPAGWQGNANVKLLATLRDLMLEGVPHDPLGTEFRQGNTLGPAHRHWFRAKFGANRFRLFFRADSASRVVVYAWVNDRDTLRKSALRVIPRRCLPAWSRTAVSLMIGRDCSAQPKTRWHCGVSQRPRLSFDPKSSVTVHTPSG